VLSMKVFGINEFAARFPNSICGVFTLLIIFNIGRKLYNIRFGFIWVMTYACSLLPFFYFKSGIIDPWFNLFIFIGVYFWVKAFDTKELVNKTGFIILSATSLGLAVLTKGPAAIFVFGIVVVILFLLNGFKMGINWKSLLIFLFTLILIGGFWFLLQIVTGNFDLMVNFINYQIRLFKTEDAGHGGFPLYHFVILLFGVFPASVFAIQGHRYIGKRNFRKVFHSSMILLFWVVLVLFSIVRTKIVHYSSLSYFPLAYLAAFSIKKIDDGRFKFQKWQKILLGFIGLTLAGIVILLPVFNEHKQFLIDKGIVTDPFIAGNLQANPGWTYLHSLIGICLLAGLTLSLLIIRNKPIVRIYTLFFSSLVFVYLTIIFVTSGAERISQNAAIEFIQQAGNKNAYVYSFYKSYAPPFYSNQPVPDDHRIFDQKWLTKGTIDKDVYFIARIDEKNYILSRFPELTFYYEKNGYIFFVRHTLQNSIKP
jgi:hypothetical protein